MTNTIFTHNNKVNNQREAFGKEFLISTLDWVTSTFYPDDIYEAQELKERCASEFKVDDVYTNEDILGYVQSELLAGKLSAEDVVPVKDLEQWAKDNGYTK